MDSHRGLTHTIHKLGQEARGREVQTHAAELFRLQTELRELIASGVMEWFETIPSPADMAARDLFTAGGKRLRPILTLLSAGIAEAPWDDALPVATAVELLHTGTLLHDDVVDQGDQRRGQPTARTVFGNSVAVLAGDYCFFAALDALINTGDHVLLSRAVDVARELATGELMQLERRGALKESTPATYFEIIEHKTASLFSFATWGGARIAGGSDLVQDRLDDFGRHLGTGFQIVDDILDFTADTEAFGKSLGQDIADGNLTLPVLYAIDEEPALLSTIERVARGLEGNVEPAEGELMQILQKVKQTAAIERSAERANLAIQDAVESLNGFPPGAEYAALVTICEGVMQRLEAGA